MSLIARMAAIAALVLTAGLAAPDGAGAESPIPAPQADYAATEIMTGGGQTVQSQVYRSGGKERREMTANGQRMAMIVRPDQQKLFMLMPGNGMAMKMDFAQSKRDLDAADLQRFSAEPVGRETVAGLETTKYKLSGTDQSGHGFDGHAWITDDGIRVKLEGTATGPQQGQTPVRIVLKDVQRGPQPADLFELPQNVQVMEMPAMQGQQGMFGAMSQ